MFSGGADESVRRPLQWDFFPERLLVWKNWAPLIEPGWPRLAWCQRPSPTLCTTPPFCFHRCDSHSGFLHCSSLSYFLCPSILRAHTHTHTAIPVSSFTRLIHTTAIHSQQILLHLYVIYNIFCSTLHVVYCAYILLCMFIDTMIIAMSSLYSGCVCFVRSVETVLHLKINTTLSFLSSFSQCLAEIVHTWKNKTHL